MPPDVFRQIVCKRFFQEVFAFSAADLEMIRQPRRPLYHFMVQEGRARFDGGSHRHPVGFDKQVAREIGVQIGIERLVEERPLGRVKFFCEKGLRIIRVERKLAFP